MRILRDFLMMVMLVGVFVATWHFDFVFRAAEGIIEHQKQSFEQEKEEEKAEVPVLAGALLENGTFKARRLELEEDEYKKYKYLSEFRVEECEGEECVVDNAHILWLENEYLFKLDKPEGDQYYGPFVIDRKEALAYLRKNKYLVKSSNICDMEIEETEIGGLKLPIRADYEGLGYLGEFFTDIECGQRNVENISSIEDGMWIAGLNLSLVEEVKVRPEINKLLLENGFACVVEGDEESIESIDLDRSAEQICDFYENEGHIDIELIKKLHKYAPWIETADCVDCG